MPYVIGGVIVVILIVGFIFNYRRSKKINAQGVEADAFISRIQEIEHTDDNGNRDVEYQYYVKYRDGSGAVFEAKLGNPPAFAREGQQVRIKYLPEKPKYALMVKQ